MITNIKPQEWQAFFIKEAKKLKSEVIEQAGSSPAQNKRTAHHGEPFVYFERDSRERSNLLGDYRGAFFHSQFIIRSHKDQLKFDGDGGAKPPFFDLGLPHGGSFFGGQQNVYNTSSRQSYTLTSQLAMLRQAMQAKSTRTEHYNALLMQCQVGWGLCLV